MRASMILFCLRGALIVAAFVPTLAIADDRAADARVTVDRTTDVRATRAPRLADATLDELVAFHRDIAARIDAGEHAALSPRDRARVAREQKALFATLAGHREFDELDEAQRLRVFNAHEAVVAVIEGRADQRVVCKDRQRTGSHLRQVDCATAAERARRARDQDQFLRRPSACSDPATCRSKG